MLYAQVINGNVIAYPLKGSQWKAIFTTRSFPGIVADADLPNTIVRVLETKAPAITKTQRLVVEAPSFHDGAWRQSWAIEEGEA